jgi:hypothetical protein
MPIVLEHCGLSLSDHEPIMSTIQIKRRKNDFRSRKNYDDDTCGPWNRENSGPSKLPSLGKYLLFFWNICLIPYLYEIFVDI